MGTADTVSSFELTVHSENLGSISSVTLSSKDEVTNGQVVGALLSAVATIINEIESPEMRSKQVSLVWSFLMEQCIYKEGEQ
ncbi:hypothetical protein ACL1HT_13025 [Corynebacterium striatum]|uniref:hypothetical protein n=1 Tax=Corynebacterium striatum TaxID=43770 RepID=UPI001A286725|nr:hypothetical protein [Corynebacterium striatum]HAT1303630.1 hypothetical protein [Corynebacterium striatum]HAT1365330.1 hypothetical protein [Corynebacterium striatum]HAT1392331.1 hypothetical protein [Corynebacterium striatum]